MVFSSLPVYLDPPNWPLLHQDTEEGGPGEINSQLPPLMPPPPLPPPPPVLGGGAAAVRPGSMAERARVAKLPQPEACLNCPRCESTNTKFCYFNNYSLTQPRHFCKTCRRYWTRGGALRNVPVGGGCRRNKRSKSSRSKSPITSSTTDRQSSSTSTCSTTAVSSNNTSCYTDNINVVDHHAHLPIRPAQLSFFPHLHNLADDDFGNNADIVGLSFGQLGIDFHNVGNTNTTTTSASMGTVRPLNLSARSGDQWRAVQPPQFPFLAAGSLEHYFGYGDGTATDQLIAPKTTLMEAAAAVAASSEKQEESTHQQGPNLSRNFLSISNPGNEQYYWGTGNAWTDVSAPSTNSSVTYLM